MTGEAQRRAAGPAAAAHQLATMLDASALILLPSGDRLGIAASYPPEDRLSDADRARFLAILYYPREAVARVLRR